MKKQSSNPRAKVDRSFREISLAQISSEPIRIIHRSFTIEIPPSIQPDQLTAIIRGLA